MGPDGSLRLQSPLLFSKARRGHKFEHEDSVQIAVTLASEGETRPGEGEGIRLPSARGPNPFLFPSREKHGAETHTAVHDGGTCCSPHGCGHLSKKADEHTYRQTREGTQASTHIGSHQGNIITVTVHRGSSSGSLSIHCGVYSSLFLFSSFRARSLSLLSLPLSHTHTHTNMIEGHR